MTAFLTLEAVLEIHREVIEATGGSPGVRDVGLLDSAVHRPQASFGGVLLYPDLAHQAAALLESLGRNHPFVDANKRTAFTAMDTFLRHNDKRIAATEDEKYEFVINVVTGQCRFETIVAWTASHMHNG
jgi:death-on-curing protein